MSKEADELQREFQRIIDQETILVDVIRYLETRAGNAYAYRDEARAKLLLEIADEISRSFEGRRRQNADATITRLNEVANKSYPLRSTIPDIVKAKRPY